MQALSFYLILPLIYLVSLLPLRFLFLISDFLVYPLIYHVLGYRKLVVRTNLKNAFPYKLPEELRLLERKYFHYLSDLFMETIKGFWITEKELNKRFTISGDYSLPNKWFDKNQNFMLSVGHYGNYEWFAMGLNLFFKHDAKAPYHEMKNSYFNNLFLKARTKFGTNMFPRVKTAREIRQAGDNPFVLVLGNDQSAPPKRSYWTTFLNQDTSFFNGTEKIARKLNIPVLFGETICVKRGYYRLELKLICLESAKEKEGEIMRKHACFLENLISREPQYWLWSHKRWKHKKPDFNEK